MAGTDRRPESPPSPPRVEELKNEHATDWYVADVVVACDWEREYLTHAQTAAWRFRMDRHEVIEAGMSYPIPEIIERYAEEQDLPMEAAEEHAREAKRYLLLCALHPEKTYGMRGPIDEFWHTFVTFTRPYADFCGKVAGRFLHHFPNTAPKTREKYSFQPGDQNAATLKIASPDLREAYLEMLTDYEAVFGEPAPKHLWPRPHVGENAGAGFCGCHCRCGCRCIA